MNWKPIRRVNYLVVHCSATKPAQDIGAAEIDRWHRERGFFMIGYQYVIRRNGVIEVGRPETQPGAHARGFNHVSIGICLVGGVDERNRADNNFTDEQFASLEQLLRDLKIQYPDARIVGHRDLPKVDKACPSFDVQAWAAERGLI